MLTNLNRIKTQVQVGCMSAMKLFFVVAVVAIGLQIAGALMDGPQDYSEDWKQSAQLQALQETENGTARQQHAAQALCNSERGPNSEARWTPEGDLVCTTRSGFVVVAGKP